MAPRCSISVGKFSEGDGEGESRLIFMANSGLMVFSLYAPKTEQRQFLKTCLHYLLCVLRTMKKPNKGSLSLPGSLSHENVYAFFFLCAQKGERKAGDEVFELIFYHYSFLPLVAGNCKFLVEFF